MAMFFALSKKCRECRQVLWAGGDVVATTSAVYRMLFQVCLEWLQERMSKKTNRRSCGGLLGLRVR